MSAAGPAYAPALSATRPAASSNAAQPAATRTDASPAPAAPASIAPEAVWPRVKELAGLRLRSMLEHMAVREVTPRQLTLAVAASRAAMARDHLEEIVRLVQETGARGMSISLVEVSRPAPAESGDERSPAPAADSAAAGEPATEPGLTIEGAEDHPLVREALRVFGAKVVHVEPKRGRGPTG